MVIYMKNKCSELIISYLTKQTEQTMTILVTHDLIMQLRIFVSLMSLTRISVLDLYLCHIGLRHIICVIILICWLFSLGFWLWLWLCF